MARLLTNHLNDLRRRNARPATLRARRLIITRLDGWLGDVELEDATRDELQAWQDALRVCVVSKRTYTANVRAFYRWAYEDERIERDPAARLLMPRIDKMLPRPVPEDHLNLALRTATGDLTAKLILAAFVGLRVSEIAAIRREDVIEDPTGTYLVVHGKGGKERVVPLVGDVRAQLSPWLRGGRGPVFLTARGRQTDGQKVSAEISAHLHGLGLPHTAHQLRHRFGTRLYGATRDLRLVQEVMGHANASQTAGYVQLGTAAQAEGMSEVAGGLSEARRRLSSAPEDGSAAPAA